MPCVKKDGEEDINANLELVVKHNITKRIPTRTNLLFCSTVDMLDAYFFAISGHRQPFNTYFALPEHFQNTRREKNYGKLQSRDCGKERGWVV